MRVRGWAVPLLTAAFVVALVLGVHALVTGDGGGGGPDQDEVERVVDTPTPDPVDLSRDVAQIVGYRVRGSDLVLTYRIRYDDCRDVEVQVAAAEALDSVAVRLLTVPGDEPTLAPCPDRPVEQVVRVPLQKPLLYRTVLDASAGGVSVPRLG